MAKGYIKIIYIYVNVQFTRYNNSVGIVLKRSLAVSALQQFLFLLIIMLFFGGIC